MQELQMAAGLIFWVQVVARDGNQSKYRLTLSCHFLFFMELIQIRWIRSPKRPMHSISRLYTVSTRSGIPAS